MWLCVGCGLFVLLEVVCVVKESVSLGVGRKKEVQRSATFAIAFLRKLNQIVKPWYRNLNASHTDTESLRKNAGK
jgi:hypothetical protein